MGRGRNKYFGRIRWHKRLFWTWCNH